MRNWMHVHISTDSHSDHMRHQRVKVRHKRGEDDEKHTGD